MIIYDVPIAEIEWTIWWMLGSAALTLIGFIGWQIGKFFVGATAIIERDQTKSKYNWVREKMLPGYLANQPFKRHVAGRGLQNPIYKFFFNLMALGLAVHVGFWLYAANFINL